MRFRQPSTSSYADREGNVFYLYNATFPRRSSKFDWSKPVDGSNPETNGRAITRWTNCRR
jgi:acyl-homoserine lactone acylase PvdQ